MKISLVIPTCERAEYLESSVKTALNVDDKNFEIVVSDNCSSDNTRDIIHALSDPRLSYFRLSSRASMRANFEFALGRCTGDYIIFIGDDDGVLPGGMQKLRGLLETHRPDAVCWENFSYVWPSLSLGQTQGFVDIKYKALFGSVVQRNSSELEKKLIDGRLRSYRDLPNIYHGCISRKLIDKVKKENGGAYFAGVIPDVYAAIANTFTIDTPIFWAGDPVTFGGISERSNGANQMTSNKMSRLGRREVERFKAESVDQMGSSNIDPSIASVDALTLAMLCQWCKETARYEKIDWHEWLTKIVSKLNRLNTSKHNHALQAIQSFAVTQGKGDCMQLVLRNHVVVDRPEVAPAPARLSNSIGMAGARLSGPSGFGTVFDASKVITRLTRTSRLFRVCRLCRLIQFILNITK